MPGFAERVQAELQKLAFGDVKVQVRTTEGKKRASQSWRGAAKYAKLWQLEQPSLLPTIGISKEMYEEFGPERLHLFKEHLLSNKLYGEHALQ